MLRAAYIPLHENCSLRCKLIELPVRLPAHGVDPVRVQLTTPANDGKPTPENAPVVEIVPLTLPDDPQEVVVPPANW